MPHLLASSPPTPSSPLFDFATGKGRAGWNPTHDIADLLATPEGLRVRVNGDDPYFTGPPVQVPTGKPLWLSLRLRASQSGTGQVFFFADGSGASEINSVRFPVRGGSVEEVRVPLPALPAASAYRFRIDPPGGVGSETVFVRLDITERVLFTEPVWLAPQQSGVENGFHLRSGDLQVAWGTGWNAFDMQIAGERWATGYNRLQVGYQTAPEKLPVWLDVVAQVPGEARHFQVERSGRTVRVTAKFTDDNKGEWQLTQKFTPGRVAGSFDVELTAKVNADRYVIHIPWFALLPGAGSFEQAKTQALFAGLEYLDGNEPSSSQADVKGEGALRHIPDDYKITLPLMALCARERWMGLVWEPSPWVAPLFDSPSRKMAGGGHLLALLCPGTEGDNARAPGALLPYAGRLLKANEMVAVRATLYAGRGANIVPAIEAAVRSGVHSKAFLPPVPKADKAQTVRTLAAGWLDSKARAGTQFRHAYPGDFGPQSAGDAVACQAWLAGEAATSGTLANRLSGGARETRSGVSERDWAFASVGHVRTFAPLLLHTPPERMGEALRRVRDDARAQLARLAPNGTLAYTHAPGKTDLGATHFARHANGLTAEVVLRVLEAAQLTGDPTLARDGVRRLHQLGTLYKNQAPRGAQTWEVPLHTPDILASAHLVRAFVRGFEMTGDQEFINGARYWAWTGVPFVYLRNPTNQPVGTYATIAVYGATQWTAPNWIGLPVQWCGLVYADALYDLARYDKEGHRVPGKEATYLTWLKIADGIVASGVQQTWPAGGANEAERARQGLLPDSFNLPGQVRNDVCINPATLQIPYARSIKRPLYTREPTTITGPGIHAPGRVRVLTVVNEHNTRFVVENAPENEFTVLVSGFRGRGAQVRVNGRAKPEVQVTPLDASPNASGFLALRVRNRDEIEMVYE